jgi:hypothetical protein
MPCPSVIEASWAFRHPSCTPSGSEKSNACDSDRRTEFCHVRLLISNPGGGHTYGRHTPHNQEALHHHAMAPPGLGVPAPWPTRSKATGDACVSASPGRVLDLRHSPYAIGVRLGWCGLQREDEVDTVRGVRRKRSTRASCVRQPSSTPYGYPPRQEPAGDSSCLPAPGWL